MHKQIKKRYEQLTHEISQLRSDMEKLPEGKLLCVKNGNYYKWLKSDGHQQSLIPKSNRSLAEQLAVRKFLSLKIQDLVREKKAIEFYLNHYKEPHHLAEQLCEHPGYKELLLPYFTPLSEELSNWSNEAYEHNPKYPEQLTIPSISGNIVRSKSEAMIDMFLFTNRIPFRYECALHLDNITLFPDFTIRHPKTGQFYYWEHFGKMDDPSYAQNAYSKLRLYHSHGIIPTIDLIITCETLEHPLNPNLINKTLEYYFL